MSQSQSEPSRPDSDPVGGQGSTAETIVGTVYGVFALANGLGFFFLAGAATPGMFWTGAGLVSIPATRRRFESIADASLSTSEVVVFVMVASFLGAVTAIIAVIAG
ncbi:hypothetical protein [Salinilacihabitans rarus]|uniref:hypothetical protein n=1 Tax=Salinilacihabitans rarus TaxID=2961596 RepID=UPI0020C87167|nr:hypothetical protein [Salinilacihabitans rarus]